LASKIGENAASRRSGKSRPERSSKLSDATLDIIISSTRNSYRDTFLEHQINQFSLDTHSRTLERNLKTRRDAQRYKKRKIKAISKTNKTTRVAYATKHQHKLFYFWRYILITNKAHFDPDAEIREYILKQKRTTIADKNLQEMTPKNKSKPLHIADGVSYYTRTSLIFYNNKTKTISNIVVKDARSTKLKQESNNTHDQYKTRLTE